MERIGLVFSGGGGKGAYEIGVWNVLSAYNISPYICAVSGTSVGALNAALFANGNLKQAQDAWANISKDLLLKPIPKEVFESTWSSICELFEALHSISLDALKSYIASIPQKAFISIKQIPEYIKDFFSITNLSSASKKVLKTMPHIVFLAISSFLPVPFSFFPRYLVVGAFPGYPYLIYKSIYSLVKLHIPFSSIYLLKDYFFEKIDFGLFTNTGLKSLIHQSIPNLKLHSSSIPCIVTAINTSQVLSQNPLISKITPDKIQNKIHHHHFHQPTEPNANLVAFSHSADYFLLNDASNDLFERMLLASSALPFIYPNIEIGATKYIDGGWEAIGGDNTPIFPLVTYAQCTAIIVVHLSDTPNITQYSKYFSKIDFIHISPSSSLGDFRSGTLNFSPEEAYKRITLGENDAKHMLFENNPSIYSWL